MNAGENFWLSHERGTVAHPNLVPLILFKALINYSLNGGFESAISFVFGATLVFCETVQKVSVVGTFAVTRTTVTHPKLAALSPFKALMSFLLIAVAGSAIMEVFRASFPCKKSVQR